MCKINNPRINGYYNDFPMLREHMCNFAPWAYHKRGHANHPQAGVVLNVESA